MGWRNWKNDTGLKKSFEISDSDESFLLDKIQQKFVCDFLEQFKSIVKMLK